jgi:cell fate regulator YaaT (PSP1 superfamily)
LRYEYDTYVELQRELPPIGSEVTLEKGKARVIGQEILAQQLLVEFEDNRRTLVEAADVESVSRRSAKGKSIN